MWTSFLAFIMKPRTWVILGLTAALIWVFYIYNDRHAKIEQLTISKTEIKQTQADLKATQEKQVEINTALDNAQAQVDVLQNTSNEIQAEVKKVPNDKTPVSKPVATALGRLCRFDNPPCR